MADYNSIHTGPKIDQGVSDALPGGRLDQAIVAAIETAVGRAVAQLAAKYHAEQHAADGPDPVTPASIGAFATDGSSTLTGNFVMSKGGSPQFKMANTTTGRSAYQLNSESTKSLQFINQLDSNNYNMLRINPETDSLEDALTLVNRVAGVSKTYKLLHEGNAAGYVGTTRTIVGTYEGTGYNGKNKPCVIECGFAPKFGIVYQQKDDAQGDDLFAFFVHGQKGIQFGCNSAEEGWIPVVVQQMANTTWGDTNISWYNTVAGGSTGSGYCQMNDDDTTYSFVFWG